MNGSDLTSPYNLRGIKKKTLKSGSGAPNLKGALMSVIRIKHDKNYVCIHKGALEDPNLSFKAKGLWAYCMSKPNDWEFHVTHLATVCKDKKTVIYSCLKELIKAGYCERLYKMEKGRRTGVEYVINEIPNLKISLRHSGNLNLENLNLENQPLLSNDSSLVSNEKQSNRSAPPPVSAEAESLCELFLKKIKERSPGFKDPNLVKWKACFDLLLRIDKRCPKEARELIEWASTHKWWKSACLSPEKLRKAWDEMTIQKVSDSEKSVVQQNRTYALKLKEKYPEQMKAMTFDDKYVINRAAGKEVPFNLPSERFKEVIISLFGGTYVAKGR